MTTDSSANAPAPQKAGLIRRLAPLLIFIAALAFAWWQGWLGYFSLESLAENRAWLQSQVADNFLLTAVIFVALYAVIGGLPVALWMTIAGGFLFGPFLGTALNATGATLAAVIMFTLVKFSFGDALRARLGGRAEKFADGFSENAFSYLLTLRLIPVVPFWMLNIIPSVLGVRLSTFAAATAIGILPGGFVYTSVGNGIGAVIDEGGSPDLGVIFQPAVLLPLIGLGLLSLMPVVWKKIKGNPV